MYLFDFLPVKHGNIDDFEDDGTRHFMVNVIEPQFNLHSEDANVSFGTLHGDLSNLSESI